MNLKLDHIVHFIDRHPAEAIDKLNQEGLKGYMGGRHPLWGTYNSVIYFNSSYIEFLAVEEVEIAASSDNPLIQQLIKGVKRGERIGQLCFRTEHIGKLQEQMASNGIKTVIHKGRRTRKDGKLIKWKMLFAEGGGRLPYPFFIEWEQKDKERFNDLRNTGILLPSQESHAVKTIKILTENKSETAESWAKLLGGTSPVKQKTAGESLIVQAGGCRIDFSEPYSEETENIFSEFGETIWQVTYSPSLKENRIHIYGGIYQ
ncbi:MULTISPECIES: VOC family protein [Bacillus]|uniref:VOC family protein n=1 Tax=Bacillus TaxID=1386 RepID=UPI0020A0F23C|nr:MULTISPECIES: VOC family protein [Bacillus]MCP1158506.1 VOC family protein [Bacillus infantis]MDT0158902.1 VOC family protein [Bacillus sp. AG4(2022)]